MLVCIQCALERLAAGDLTPATFDETPEQHMARVHPVGVSRHTRAEVEQAAAKMIARLRSGDAPRYPESEPHTITDTDAKTIHDLIRNPGKTGDSK